MSAPPLGRSFVLLLLLLLLFLLAYRRSVTRGRGRSNLAVGAAGGGQNCCRRKTGQTGKTGARQGAGMRRIITPVFAGQTPLVKQLVKHRCGRKTGQTPQWAQNWSNWSNTAVGIKLVKHAVGAKLVKQRCGGRQGAGMRCIITYTESTKNEDFYGEVINYNYNDSIMI